MCVLYILYNTYITNVPIKLSTFVMKLIISWTGSRLFQQKYTNSNQGEVQNTTNAKS